MKKFLLTIFLHTYSVFLSWQTLTCTNPSHSKQIFHLPPEEAAHQEKENLRLPCWTDGRSCMCTVPCWTCPPAGARCRRARSWWPPPPHRRPSRSCSPPPRRRAVRPSDGATVSVGGGGGGAGGGLVIGPVISPVMSYFLSGIFRARLHVCIELVYLTYSFSNLICWITDSKAERNTLTAYFGGF